jgi:hypothetical protein
MTEKSTSSPLRGLSLKGLLYYLDFKDEKVWNDNKYMIGYKDKEEIQSDGSIDFTNFFERIHGYHHHQQQNQGKKTNPNFFMLFNFLNDKITKIESRLEILESKNKSKTEKMDYYVEPSIIKSKFYS